MTDFYGWLTVAPLGDDAFFEGIKNYRLVFSGRLISCLIHCSLWDADLCLIHWAALPLLDDLALKTY